MGDQVHQGNGNMNGKEQTLEKQNLQNTEVALIRGGSRKGPEG